MSNVYQSINYAVLSKVPQNSQSILDVGCGTGSLGQEIKKNINCQITGLTHSTEEASLATKKLDRVVICDLNCFNAETISLYDCIICSHVLEHLYQPEEFLLRIRSNLSSEGKLIVALPNILHWKQRLEFLKGNFKYTDGGLMDSTHYRFFDWDTALNLVQSSGLKVVSYQADAYFPLPVVRKLFKPLACKLDQVASQIAPSLLGSQFIIVAKH